MNSNSTIGVSSAPSGAPTLGAVGWLALVLMIIGGINWGLVGVFSFDLVAALFGSMSMLSRGIYALVGIAALYGIVLAARLGSRT